MGLFDGFAAASALGQRVGRANSPVGVRSVIQGVLKQAKASGLLQQEGAIDLRNDLAVQGMKNQSATALSDHKADRAFEDRRAHFNYEQPMRETAASGMVDQQLTNAKALHGFKADAASTQSAELEADFQRRHPTYDPNNPIIGDGVQMKKQRAKKALVNGRLELVPATSVQFGFLDEPGVAPQDPNNPDLPGGAEINDPEMMAQFNDMVRNLLAEQ